VTHLFPVEHPSPQKHINIQGACFVLETTKILVGVCIPDLPLKLHKMSVKDWFCSSNRASDMGYDQSNRRLYFLGIQNEILF